ncbi:MAG TPA: RIO1 family regulatory kinase/ATPase [Nitrososphaerales archaeon]|nr:RIO1 family regulatory kinase/ATPase [Nitrososphaerales archaeon]
MSSTENAARALKSLKDEEWRTLAGLERASTGYGTPDLGRLSRMSRLPPERVKFAIDALERKRLASRRGNGFVLTREGVELMALKDYVKKDLIFALGAIIAKGKESDVYEALTEEGSVYALKVYKIGRTSFTNVRKKRVRESAEFRSWVTANYNAAQREYHALRKLEGLSPVFPKAVAYSRSTVLLEELSGVRLSQRPYMEDPAAALKVVIESMRKAYGKARLVNSDLSEYNILTDGSSVWLIDWPQAVEATHPNSGELLLHDVNAVTTFFRRAYGVETDPKMAYDYVVGKSSRLE